MPSGQYTLLKVILVLHGRNRPGITPKVQRWTQILKDMNMEKEEEYKGEDQVHQTVGSDQKGRQIRRRRPRYFFGQNSTFLYSLFSRREMAFRLTQGLLIVLFCVIIPTVDQVYSLIRYVSHIFKNCSGIGLAHGLETFIRPTPRYADLKW